MNLLNTLNLSPTLTSTLTSTLTPVLTSTAPLKAAQGASLAAVSHGAIGVFDSGLGGLSVLAHLQAAMPCESFIYLADNAHVPYGDKSEDWIRARMVQMTDWFLAQGCKAIVWACNTATAAGATYVRQRYPEVFFVGLEPALKPAVSIAHAQSVVVLATHRTICSDKYIQLRTRLAQQHPAVAIHSVACIGWAEAIENGHTQGSSWHTLLARHLNIWLNQADVFVLGCTHYPFVARDIQAYLSEHSDRPPHLIDSGAPVARYTQTVLAQRHGLSPQKTGQIVYYATASSAHFVARWSVILGQADLVVLPLSMSLLQ